MILATVVPDAPDGLYDSGLPIQELFGVPIHPLVVHSALVLLPLAAIGLIATSTSIRRSKRYGGLVALVATVGFVMAFLAVTSGRDLAGAFQYTDQLHFQLGEWVFWFGLALMVVCGLLWLLDKKPSERAAPAKLLALLGMVVAVATIALIAWTGITGEQLTWA